MALIVHVIRDLFSLYWYILLATAVMGFLPDLRETRLGSLLTRITDPYLYVFRKYIPAVSIGQVSLDLSWIAGVIVFLIVQSAVTNMLFRLLMTAS